MVLLPRLKTSRVEEIARIFLNQGVYMKPGFLLLLIISVLVIVYCVSSNTKEAYLIRIQDEAAIIKDDFSDVLTKTKGRMDTYIENDMANDFESLTKEVFESFRQSLKELSTNGSSTTP
jgi:hypothetical protein